MKIAGIYPKTISGDQITSIYGEPLGLEYVLARIDQNHEIDIFTPFNHKEEDFFESIINYNPDIIAFTLTTCEFDFAKKITNKLKNIYPKLISIAGGPHPTAMKEVEKPFDFYISGEGEESFKELVNEINNKTQNFKHIHGLSYFKENGKLIKNSLVERIKNLDEFTPLRFKKFHNLKFYGASHLPLSKQRGHAFIDYSRGCYHNCSYCESPNTWGRMVIHKSAKKITDEIKELKHLYGLNTIFFSDLNFTQRKDKVLQLCEEMIKNDLKMDWYCQSNITTADKELLQAMKEAGCVRIWWGVESTNNTSLKKTKKNLENKKTEKILKEAHDMGILNQLFYMIGFPWDTEDSILKETEVLRNYYGHQLRVTIATPLLGSEWFNKIDKNLLSKDRSLYDTNHLVYNHPSLTPKKTKYLQQEVFRKFYENNSYLERILDITEKLKVENPYLKDSFIEYLDGISYFGVDTKNHILALNNIS